MNPSASSVSLTIPWRPRITIQAKVRTTTLVKSGISTIKVIVVRTQAGERMNSQATGRPRTRQSKVTSTPSQSVEASTLRLKVSPRNLTYWAIPKRVICGSA